MIDETEQTLRVQIARSVARRGELLVTEVFTARNALILLALAFPVVLVLQWFG